VDLQSLREVLEPLTKFGQDEFTFEVEGLKVTIRPLLPREEIACQQYSSQVLKDTQEEEELGDDDPLTRAASLRYFDQFRSEVISYALVQVGENDLRNVKALATGKKLEDGTPVRVPLQRALRDLINASWSRAMITICFAKYGDMVTVISEKADKIAKDSIADLDAEIERVEARLERIRSERDLRAKGDPSVTSQQIKSLVQAGKALDEELNTALEQAQADRVLAAALSTAGDVPEDPDAPPEQASPPLEHEEPPTPAPTPTPRQSVVPKASPPPTAPIKQPSPPELRSSFGELEDVDSQAIEHDRLVAAQVAARASARKDLETGGLSAATPEGTVTTGDGKELDAFRLPSETISARGVKRKKVDEKEANLDPKPGGGTRNPKFKPPGS
jgi:hypothetical protein